MKNYSTQRSTAAKTCPQVVYRPEEDIITHICVCMYIYISQSIPGVNYVVAISLSRCGMDITCMDEVKHADPSR